MYLKNNKNKREQSIQFEGELVSAAESSNITSSYQKSWFAQGRVWMGILKLLIVIVILFIIIYLIIFNVTVYVGFEKSGQVLHNDSSSVSQ